MIIAHFFINYKINLNIYQEIKTLEFPFRSEAEQLIDLIQYSTEKFIQFKCESNCYKCNNRIEIPLEHIHKDLLKECTCSKDHLREVLTKCGYKIEKSKSGHYILILSGYGSEENLDDTNSCYSNKLSSSSILSLDENYYEQKSLFNDTDFIEGDDKEEEENWEVDFVDVVPMVDDYIVMDINEQKDNGKSTTAIDGTSKSMTGECSSTVDINDRKNDVGSVVVAAATRNNGGQTSSSSSTAAEAAANAQDLNFVNKNENSDVVHSLQRCHSLENINKTHNNKINPYRFSLNIDKYKNDCDIGASNHGDNVEEINEDEKLNEEKEKNDKENLKKLTNLLTSVAMMTTTDTFGPSPRQQQQQQQEDSCCSQPSKAADSGYPNSSYGQDMDMDLTPEQVDEIITESESSYDAEADEEESGNDEDVDEAIIEDNNELVDRHVADIFRLDENVENGDVANNNRDGEGNNMEAIAAAAMAAIADGEVVFVQVIANEENLAGVVEAVAAAAAAAGGGIDSDEDFCNNFNQLSINDESISAAYEQLVEEESSNEMIQLSDRFPSWLLNILIVDDDDDDIDVGDVDDVNENDNNGAGDANEVLPDLLEINVVPDASLISGQDLLEEDDEEEIVVRGDIAGGGDPPFLPPP